MTDCITRFNTTPIEGGKLNALGFEKGCETPDMRSNEYKNRYNFGFRKIGDPLIAQKSKTHFWNTPMNVEVTFRCKTKNGYIVSHVDIQFNQSPNGQEIVKIIDGSIESDFIEISINIRNTFWLRYDVQFYGRQITCE